MKDASQYPITFGYLAFDNIFYTKKNPHMGVDRQTPLGTPLLINGILIAHTGNTGRSSGAHLHIQKVFNDMVVNPGTGGFTVPAPAVVIEVGQKPDIGKYIRIHDGQGVVWSYFHLNDILVYNGQSIGEGMDSKQLAVTKERLDYIFGASFHAAPTKADYDNWLGPGKLKLGDLVDSMMSDVRRRNYYFNTLLPALQALEEKRQREKEGIFYCTAKERQFLNLRKEI